MHCTEDEAGPHMEMTYFVPFPSLNLPPLYSLCSYFSNLTGKGREGGEMSGHVFTNLCTVF